MHVAMQKLQVFFRKWLLSVGLAVLLPLHLGAKGSGISQLGVNDPVPSINLD